MDLLEKLVLPLRRNLFIFIDALSFLWIMYPWFALLSYWVFSWVLRFFFEFFSRSERLRTASLYVRLIFYCSHGVTHFVLSFTGSWRRLVLLLGHEQPQLDQASKWVCQCGWVPPGRNSFPQHHEDCHHRGKVMECSTQVWVSLNTII